MASSASSVWQSSNPTTLTVQIGRNVSHNVPNKMELAVLLNLQTCFKATEVHTMIIQIYKKCFYEVPNEMIPQSEFTTITHHLGDDYSSKRGTEL
jgi:hypothetical protein